MFILATYTQAARKVDDARLGGTINWYDKHRIETHDGAHVKHKPPIAAILLAHVLQSAQSRVDDAALKEERERNGETLTIPHACSCSPAYQIDQKRALDILVIEYARHVDHNINVAKGLFDLLVGGLHALLVGHIHFDDHDALRGMRRAQLDKLLQIILYVNNG